MKAHTHMTLAIDSRERGLLKCLIEKYSIDPAVKQLSLGDAMVSTGTKTILVERKTVADLAASIADGRYREQRARLLDAQGSGCTAMYIIEGSYSKCGIPYTTLLSAMLSCAVKYKFPVVQTASIEETCYLLTRLVKDIDALCDGTVDEEFVPQKRMHIDPRIGALASAKRVSPSVARRVLEHYGTVADVVDAFRRDGPHALCCMERIGKTTSEALYKSLTT